MLLRLRSATAPDAWVAALAVLVAIRVAIPLAALAASGTKLPGLPRYTYGPLTGDATAYFSTARALLAGWREIGPGGLAAAALVVLLGAAFTAHEWRHRRAERPWLLAGFLLLLGVVTAAAISQTGRSPAGAVGWPLLWSVPLAPLRALHSASGDPAFGAGLALSLAANAVTVVATAYAGAAATGRRSVGLAAAALFALWPLLAAAVGGTKGWGNGTWEVDAGLHLYTEPLSTACVAAGIALLLAPGRTPVRLVWAGFALGYAVAVRPTNALAGLLALAYLVAEAGARRALPVVAGALAVAPVVIAFLPKRTGYELHPVSDAAGALVGARYAGSSWTDSLLFGPRALAVLVPLALLGAVLLRSRRSTALLLGWAASNAIFYTFVRATAEHPRYLFASLPAVLILWAAGVAGLIRAAVRLRVRSS